jgi:hypothetical protein
VLVKPRLKVRPAIPDMAVQLDEAGARAEVPVLAPGAPRHTSLSLEVSIRQQGFRHVLIIHSRSANVQFVQEIDIDESQWRPNVGGTFRGNSATTESDLDNGWVIGALWVHRRGRVRLDKVTLRPPPNRDTMVELKAMMRRLHMGAVGREWESALRGMWLDLPERWRSGLAESPRPGRAGHPPEFYAEWAQRYVAACERRDQPVAWLVDQHPGVSKQSIARYLAKAEQLDLITNRPGRGRAGGELTERARHLLTKTGGPES